MLPPQKLARFNRISLPYQFQFFFHLIFFFIFCRRLLLCFPAILWFDCSACFKIQLVFENQLCVQEQYVLSKMQNKIFFLFYIKFERKAIENHKKLIVFRFSVRYPVFFGDFFGENCRQKYRRNSFFEAFIEKKYTQN